MLGHVDFIHLTSVGLMGHTEIAYRQVQDHFLLPKG